MYEVVLLNFMFFKLCTTFPSQLSSDFYTKDLKRDIGTHLLATKVSNMAHGPFVSILLHWTLLYQMHLLSLKLNVTRACSLL